VATRKDLRPGDLVIGQTTSSLQQDVGIIMGMGVIIGVDYPREGHMGCEDRIKVMWSNPVRFEQLCDCGLVTADTF